MQKKEEKKKEEMQAEMQAEPRVIYGGKVSDISEHLFMLDNPEASRMADELAIREAVESGMFTEERARALMSGPEDLEALKRTATQKMDYSVVSFSEDE